MVLEKSDFAFTELDREIVDSVIREKTNREIAEATGYSLGTIKFRLGIIFRRYGVKTKVGLVREVLTREG